MDRNGSFFKCFFFIYILLLCMACKKDGHFDIAFVNHSKDTIWLNFIQIVKSEDFLHPRITVNPGEVSLISAPSHWDPWEDFLGPESIIRILVYDEPYIMKDTSPEYLNPEHLLKEYWCTKEDLDKLKWAINYYPEENNIKSNHAD